MYEFVEYNLFYRVTGCTFCADKVKEFIVGGSTNHAHDEKCARASYARNNKFLSTLRKIKFKKKIQNRSKDVRSKLNEDNY